MVKIAIVVCDFNEDITQPMEEAALARAEELEATVVRVVHVPGAFEMPLAVRKLLKMKQVEAVATLGAVIKGDTFHDRVTMQQLARALTELSLKHNKPVGLGVSGPKMTHNQAKLRIEEYAHRAVEACVKMVMVMKE